MAFLQYNLTKIYVFKLFASYSRIDLISSTILFRRRSRRKPIIRIADSTENRIEFLQASSLERRSQSFDEEISNRSKQEAKFYEKSRVSHDRYASGRAEVSNLVSKGTEKSISGRTTDSKGLLESVTASSTTDDVTEFDESVGDKERESKARSDDGDVINGDVINGEDDEDLESKSVSREKAIYSSWFQLFCNANGTFHSIYGKFLVRSWDTLSSVIGNIQALQIWMLATT